MVDAYIMHPLPIVYHQYVLFDRSAMDDASNSSWYIKDAVTRPIVEEMRNFYERACIFLGGFLQNPVGENCTENVA